MYRQKRWMYVLAIALVSIGLDQYTKYLAVQHLAEEPIRVYLDDMVRILFVENTGAFLSLGSGWGETAKWLLLQGLPLVVLIGLLVYLLTARWIPTLVTIAYSFIFGGGASNIYDRLLYGKVVDFLNIGIGDIRTGIFNVADMAIMLGLFLILPTLFRPAKKPAADLVPDGAREEE